MAHDHSHQPAPDASNAGNAFWISIVLNLLYVASELGAGFYFKSMALLSDAGHNASDVASLLLSLLAFRLAKKKASDRYTYGYKKTTILAALTNAVVLLVAIGILGVETVRRFKEPAEVEGGIIAWVAGIGIVINAVSAYLFYRDRKKDLNIKSAYLHLLADALVSVGVVIAGVVIAVTGWYVLDPLIGLVVLVVILVSTWSLLADSFRLAVDAVPADIDLVRIKKVMEEVPGVKKVSHVHIWAMSTTENSLTAHVHMQEHLDLPQRMGAIREIKHRLEHENIRHSTIELSDEIASSIEDG